MSRSILEKLITKVKTLDAADFKATWNEATGRWVPARLSGLAQARLRRQAQIFGLSLPGINDEEAMRRSSCPIRLVSREDKGSIRERKRAEKQDMVRIALEKMPQTIAAWREVYNESAHHMTMRMCMLVLW